MTSDEGDWFDRNAPEVSGTTPPAAAPKLRVFTNAEAWEECNYRRGSRGLPLLTREQYAERCKLQNEYRDASAERCAEIRTLLAKMDGLVWRKAPKRVLEDARKALGLRTAKATALGGNGTEGGHDGLAR